MISQYERNPKCTEQPCACFPNSSMSILNHVSISTSYIRPQPNILVYTCMPNMIKSCSCSYSDSTLTSALHENHVKAATDTGANKVWSHNAEIILHWSIFQLTYECLANVMLNLTSIDRIYLILWKCSWFWFTQWTSCRLFVSIAKILHSLCVYDLCLYL